MSLPESFCPACRKITPSGTLLAYASYACPTIRPIGFCGPIEPRRRFFIEAECAACATRKLSSHRESEAINLAIMDRLGASNFEDCPRSWNAYMEARVKDLDPQFYSLYQDSLLKNRSPLKEKNRFST